MTITREQLELAAKAAGIDKTHEARHLCDSSGKWTEYIVSSTYQSGQRKNTYWTPLTDHGQLLDLAMACDIDILNSTGNARYWTAENGKQYQAFERNNFTSLAEAVILAASEQQLAKEKKE